MRSHTNCRRVLVDDILESALVPPPARPDNTSPPRKEKAGEGAVSSSEYHIRGGGFSTCVRISIVDLRSQAIFGGTLCLGWNSASKSHNFVAKLRRRKSQLSITARCVLLESVQRSPSSGSYGRRSEPASPTGTTPRYPLRGKNGVNSELCQVCKVERQRESVG